MNRLREETGSDPTRARGVQRRSISMPGTIVVRVVCGRWVAETWRTAGVATGKPPAALHYSFDAPWRPDPVVDTVRALMDRRAGVLRDADGLRTALAELEPHLGHETGLVGHLVVEAALRREESRGGHTRLDFPETAAVAEHILTVPSAVAAK